MGYIRLLSAVYVVVELSRGLVSLRASASNWCLARIRAAIRVLVLGIHQLGVLVGN